MKQAREFTALIRPHNKMNMIVHHDIPDQVVSLTVEMAQRINNK